MSRKAEPGQGFGYVGTGQRSSLRLSASLQDFSAYLQHDPEKGDGDVRFERLPNHAKPPPLLQRENAGSSFSKEKALSGSVSKRKKWLQGIIFFAFLLLFAFGVYFVSKYIYSNWYTGASKFYVVLDCGSTGTRVYVYQASFNDKKINSLPFTLRSIPDGLQRKPRSQIGRAYRRMETEPGFDKLVHNASGLKAAIKPLLHWVEKQIPSHAHKSTSLFLYATAGVRRLPSSDSDWLLNTAWSILKTSKFLCQREWVKVITGMEEAYYGWIALNYHTGMLGALPRQETFGALDMGGSSLQVTFESKEHVHDESSLNLSIGSINHHLAAYSLSGYGLNDAFDKSVVHLLKKLPKVNTADLANGKIELKHPCLQTGYNEQYTCSQCASLFQEAGSPVVGGKNLHQGEKAGITVRLIGAPKWEECISLAKIAVNLSEWSDSGSGIDCEMQPCALSDNLPRPYGKFHAMSGFFVVYRFFNLISEATLDDILEKGQGFCEKNWETAKNSVPPQPYIEQYCFRAPYIVLLLREGLHITDSQVIVGSGSITWTLGVALLEAGKTYLTKLDIQSYEIFQMKINPVLLFAIFFVSLFLLICALSCVGNWMPRFFRRPYLPLFIHNSTSTSSFLNRFQRWSPISTGDGRVKTPLSPTIASSPQRPFGMVHGFGSGDIQLMEPYLYPSTSVSHSYSSGSLGQMQFENNSMGSFWTPHRGQMRLQSRRSQSREDLNSSLAEAHMAKV
ncbi:Nucleoside phosphatase GDA1/CD39 [Dillenia turbinata]|uniref:Nucleoside phosphatase GDA1/CD39 n=1 Tax=Dillenia turbinata TaxID=194707 RepID=A0AAN8W5Z7_9MAGN